MEGKTVRNLLIAGIIGYGLWWGYKRFIASGNLQYGRPAIKNLRLSLSGATFDTELPIINPTATPLEVKAFSGGVYWGEYLLSPIALAAPVIIGANGTASKLVFKTEILFNQLAGNVRSAVASGDWLRNVWFRGKLTAEGLNINVNQPLLT